MSAIEYTDIVVRQQPDDVTCGPTCLHGVYDFFGTRLPLSDVIASVPSLEHGGTLAVLLGLDALDRGYSAELYTYNLDLFDPTWFGAPEKSSQELHEALRAQRDYRGGRARDPATDAYLSFLDHGGKVRHWELTPEFLEALVRTAPFITGLSSTYLYGCAREVLEGRRAHYDDVRGEPVGHFVVVSGYDPITGRFRISDPSTDNPLHGSGTYWVSPYRLIGAIFLGVTTYDGNLLVIRPGDRSGTTGGA